MDLGGPGAPDTAAAPPVNRYAYRIVILRFPDGADWDAEDRLFPSPPPYSQRIFLTRRAARKRQVKLQGKGYLLRVERSARIVFPSKETP